MNKIMIADDEKIMLTILKQEFEAEGFEVTVASDGQKAFDLIMSQKYDVIILDVKMPKLTGLEVLKATRTANPDTCYFILTAFGSIEDAVTAIKLGADDYYTKPYDADKLVKAVLQHLEFKTTQAMKVGSYKKCSKDDNFIAISPAMKKIEHQIKKIANLNTTILLTGESGTGKGVIAKRIHMIGNRSDKPFVHLDCSTLPHTLIESELFGYEKGAFTGALSSKRGKFEQAEDGTVFLDEIGTLPIELQSKFLTVLQDKEINRLSGTKKIPLNARVVVATNEDLEQAIKDHRFREDLYFRLNVVHIEIPPLRFRREDIIPLAKSTIQHLTEETGRCFKKVSDDFYSTLSDYNWPGNVRELENSIESAFILCDNDELTSADLPERILQSQSKKERKEVITHNDQRDIFPLHEQEMLCIINALDKFNNNREKTANYLGITRRSLQYKLKAYGLTNK